MRKFNEGYFYFFKSMEDHALFTRRCNENKAFAKFVNIKPFKVIETDDYGNAVRVENHEGVIEFTHLDAVNELTYFKINYGKAWCVNAGYQLKDAKSLLKDSSINIEFIRKIGYNPFIVESANSNLGSELKTSRLKYIDPNDRSKHLYLNFTLTEDEIIHFEEWARPICSGFIRGERIVSELPKRDSFGSKCGEIMNPADEMGLTNLPEADMSWVDSQVEEKSDEKIMGEIEADIAQLKPSSPKIEVLGKIRFVVEDEFTRLKAIEFLNNMVFK